MEGEILLTSKALHIIFVVAWFAALFYMPRLLIYFVEAANKLEPAKEAVQSQIIVMAGRLWKIIGWPSAVLTFVTAIAILWINPAYLSMPWMHVKLGFVLLLLIYHLSLNVLYRKMVAGRLQWKASQLRFYNELATLLLFAIVFTVVFKNTLSWAYGVGGLLLLGIALSLGIVSYKKYRKASG